MVSRRASLMLALLSAAAVLLPAGFAHAASCNASDIPPISSIIFTNFFDTLNETMNTMLSQIYGKAAPIALAAVNLYVVIYGLQVLAGIAPFNAREALGRMAKAAVVYMLMTGSASFNMNTVNNFFYSLALDIPSYLLNSSNFPNDGNIAVSGNGPELPKKLLTSLDTNFAAFLCGELDIAKDFKIIGFIGSLALLHPPLFLAAAGWIWQAFMLLVRALVSVLMSLAAITFLTTLGPIFVGFLLFETTAQLFESWLRHLVGFSLQVVFTLAAIVMWVHLLSAYKKPVEDFNKIINSYSAVHVQSTANANVDKSWSLCKPKVSPTTTGPSIQADAGCQEIPISGLLLNPEFMYFYGYYIIALLALTYGFAGLIEAAPSIAQQIANGGADGGMMKGAGLDAFARHTREESKASSQKASAQAGDTAKSDKASINYVDTMRNLVGQRNKT